MTETTLILRCVIFTRIAPQRLVLGHGAVVGDEGEPVVGHHGGQDGPAVIGKI